MKNIPAYSFWGSALVNHAMGLLQSHYIRPQHIFFFPNESVGGPEYNQRLI